MMSSARALCLMLLPLRLLRLKMLLPRSLHSRLSRLPSHLPPSLNSSYLSMTLLVLARVARRRTLPRAPPPLATAPLADSRSTTRSVAMTMCWPSTTPSLVSRRPSTSHPRARLLPSRLSSPSHRHLLQGPHEARVRPREDAHRLLSIVTRPHRLVMPLRPRVTRRQGPVLPRVIRPRRRLLRPDTTD